MSLLDGLRKERGRQRSASGSVPRRRFGRQPSNQLSADRIAAALGTVPDSSTRSAPSRAAGGVPKRASGVQALQGRLNGGASGRPAPLGSPSVDTPPGASDTGRHRGSAEQLRGSDPFQPPAAGPPRHGRAPGTALGEFSPVGSARARPMPEVPAPVAPEGGRHRRPAPRKRASGSGSLHRARPTSHRFVVLGVLVLLVAVAAVVGVRLALARPLAQPQLVATTAQGQLGGPALDAGSVQSLPPQGVR